MYIYDYIHTYSVRTRINRRQSGVGFVAMYVSRIESNSRGACNLFKMRIRQHMID